jgi:hypothetical protein
MNLVTPKALAEHGFRGEAGLLNQSSSFRCDQKHNNHWHVLDHTLVFCLSLTWMLNKRTTDSHC